MKIACGYTIPINQYGRPPSSENNLKVMREIRETGFDTVEMEIFAEKMDDYVRDFDLLKRTLKEIDLKVCDVIAVVEGKFSLDKEKSDKAIKNFKQIAGMAKELGSPLLSICPSFPPEINPLKGTELYDGGPPAQVQIVENLSWPEFWENVVEQFSKFADIAKQSGLQLSVEARAQDFLSIAEIKNLIRESGKDNTGIILDVAHIHAAKAHLELTILKMGDLIKLVHLSDNDGTRGYHYPPGKGNINFLKVLKSLKGIGYDGYLVVDIAGTDNILEEAIKAKRYFEDCLSKI